MTQRRAALYYKNNQTGKEPAREWLDSLKDRVGQSRIYARIARAESGNFGDHRPVGQSVFELRINIGPGYRIYYALEGNDIILLLVGGDKSSQSKDIEIAKQHWAAHKTESKRGD